MPQTKRKRNDPRFLDETCKKLYFDYPHKNVVPQTWYNLYAIESNGFKIIGDILRHQGWYFIVSDQFGELADGFDCDLVRQFYANLTVATDDTKLETIVNSKKICFAPIDLTLFIASLNSEEGNLSMESGGLKIKFSDNGGVFPEFDYSKDVKPLLAPAFQNIQKPNASHLTVHNRLLVHIIYNCILPRKGSLTYLPTIVLALLHYLNTRIRINLAALIMGHMLTVHNNPTHILPHATLITFWLRTYWKIKPKEPLDRSYITYDNLALNRMFLFNKDTRCWSLRNKTYTPASPSSSIKTTSTLPSIASLSDPSMTTPSMATPSDPSMATPSMTTPSDPSMDIPTDPSMASSCSKPSSSTMPCHKSPVAPPYSPFNSDTTNTLLHEITTKLDNLKLHSPSVEQFNSVSEQLLGLIRKHQTETTISLRQIADKVDSFEDKMKGFGHHCFMCMQSIHQDQDRMCETMEKIFKNQIALHQKFMHTFLEPAGSIPDPYIP